MNAPSCYGCFLFLILNIIGHDSYFLQDLFQLTISEFTKCCKITINNQFKMLHEHSRKVCLVALLMINRAKIKVPEINCTSKMAVVEM